MFPSGAHHVKDAVCLTRPPYRNGRKLRAVKVYTIAQESKYLLIQNLPSIAGNLEQLLPDLHRYGTMVNHWRLDGYQSHEKHVDCEHLFDTILVQYQHINDARRCKAFLDDRNFLGSNLHVCYAPECETVDDLREKITQRKQQILRSLSNQSRRIVQQSTTSILSDMSASRSFEQTSNDIRARMRLIVQKSNLIPLVLQQDIRKKKRLRI
jgi:RNA-binding protein 48